MVVGYRETNPASQAQVSALQDDYYSVYASQGLQVLLLVFEDESGRTSYDEVLDWSYDAKAYYELEFPVVADPNGAMWNAYQSEVPATTLIDRNGVIRYKQAGAMPDRNRLTRYIEDLLE